MKLALFDLDNTLLDGDSDYLWGEYMCELGIVDRDAYAKGNEQFHADYREGKLDIHAYLRFALEPLSRYSVEDLHRHRASFIDQEIRQRVSKASLELVDEHRQAGDQLIMITATNDFVTRPIADIFGIDVLLASDAEMKDGCYTGQATGTPCFQDGKLTKLETWLREQGVNDIDIPLRSASFYSDSRNDLPLLSRVGRPVCVNPDPVLLATANDRGWPVIKLIC
ncbi:HAD family hydrolase [Allohahella marinimesophila]|uniref:HAD family hydrolase n=1 Tax=Allohahella marinimesophila TaxID=1054972 RepID=A0ABP7PJE6_9GAMM